MENILKHLLSKKHSYSEKASLYFLYLLSYVFWLETTYYLRTSYDWRDKEQINGFGLREWFGIVFNGVSIDGKTEDQASVDNFAIYNLDKMWVNVYGSE